MNCLWNTLFCLVLVSYLIGNGHRQKMKKPGAKSVNFNEDFRCYAPIRRLCSMLLHFFDSDANFDSFSKYLTDEFLKPIFAEAVDRRKGRCREMVSIALTSSSAKESERKNRPVFCSSEQGFCPSI